MDLVQKLELILLKKHKIASLTLTSTPSLAFRRNLWKCISIFLCLFLNSHILTRSFFLPFQQMLSLTVWQMLSQSEWPNKMCSEIRWSGDAFGKANWPFFCTYCSDNSIYFIFLVICQNLWISSKIFADNLKISPENERQ